MADFFANAVTVTNYPGGTYYQSKIANGRILTLPQGNCGNGVVDSGEQCDDGNRFGGDCCSGYCQFEAAGSACAADVNECTDDICNGAGACTHPNNTSPCDDGNACTQTDTCQAGACSGTNPVQCTALDQCHDAGSCDPATGACSNPAKADGTSCDDGDACTLEECRSGICLAIDTPCGDGTVDGACGEACDDGGDNGANACCSDDCRLVDGDADSICDRDDPCTGPALTFRSKARVRHLGSDRRAATMTFKARATLPFPFDPPLDALANGVRLVFGVGDRTWTDVVIPGGGYSTAAARGWRVNGRGDLWKYVDRSGAPIAGVTSVAVRDRSAGEPGLVEIAVKAIVPGDPVAAGDLPFRLTAVFDVPVAMTGQCAATDFGGSSGACAMGRDAASLQCR